MIERVFPVLFVFEGITMQKLYETVEKYIKEEHMIKGSEKILVGLSGGADSVCLLYVLRKLTGSDKKRICACHIEHGIRGENSKKDEEFVRRLCKEWDTELYVKNFDVPSLAKKWGMGLEEAGRRVRYEAFEEISKKAGCEEIALAHHADDNAETVIFNLVRGTGLYGLCGIPPVRDKFIRPLLCVRKQDIIRALDSINRDFCVDESNEDTSYSRNLVRHKILPVLEQLNTNAVMHMQKSSEILRQTGEYLTDTGRYELMKCADISKERVIIPVKAIKDLPKAIAYHMIRQALSHLTGSMKDIGYVHTESIYELTKARTGASVDLPFGISADRLYDDIRLYNKSFCGEKKEYELKADFLKKISKAELEEKIHEKNPYTKIIDCDKIQVGLSLRNKKDGDRIAIGGGVYKKLSRIFIDEKIPPEERGNIPLVSDGENIVWILGSYLSDDYKVSSETKNAAILRIIRKDET